LDWIMEHQNWRPIMSSTKFVFEDGSVKIAEDREGQERSNREKLARLKSHLSRSVKNQSRDGSEWLAPDPGKWIGYAFGSFSAPEKAAWLELMTLALVTSPIGRIAYFTENDLADVLNIDRALLASTIRRAEELGALQKLEKSIIPCQIHYEVSPYPNSVFLRKLPTVYVPKSDDSWLEYGVIILPPLDGTPYSEWSGPEKLWEYVNRGKLQVHELQEAADLLRKRIEAESEKRSMEATVQALRPDQSPSANAEDRFFSEDGPGDQPSVLPDIPGVMTFPIDYQSGNTLFVDESIHDLSKNFLFKLDRGLEIWRNDPERLKYRLAETRKRLLGWCLSRIEAESAEQCTTPPSQSLGDKGELA
jgi:hypothetical protein